MGITTIITRLASLNYTQHHSRVFHIHLYQEEIGIYEHHLVIACKIETNPRWGNVG